MRDFEQMAEMNEGLAQYALLRGLREVGRLARGPWAGAAAREEAVEARMLDSLITATNRSVRRRFYATGSTIGRLLDRLQGPRWKLLIASADSTLEGALGVAVGYHGVSALRAPARAALAGDAARLEPAAARAISALRARRVAQRDSVLGRAGLRLTVDPASGPRPQLCGFDPQNTLAIGDGTVLHARMLRSCVEGKPLAEFDQGVVADTERGTLQTVIADTASIRITTGGRAVALPAVEGSLELTDLRLEATNVIVTAPRATLWRSAGELRVVAGAR
ncbi:MAG: hypothetical protein WKG32_10465 [Gemmatimonadaceae bacterium]